MEQKYEWLSHLTNHAIPVAARGYDISVYAIALEGWRRGLKLTFSNYYHGLNKKYQMEFTLESKNRKHSFRHTRGDLITPEAINICVNKDRAKDILLKNNIPTPIGKLFEKGFTDESVLEYVKELGYPVVVKPPNGAAGKGVIANILNEKELLSSISYVRDDLGFENIIVEKFVNGEDIRVYVIKGKVIAALKRIPANVVGDGKSNISELLKKKNIQRVKNPAFDNKPIRNRKQMELVLKKQGLSFDSVPPLGKIIYLKSTNNLSTGGDPYDITDQIDEHIKKIAVKAAKAIGGLPHCGVDLLVNFETGDANVIEINTKPSIRAHLFPQIGKSRDIAKELIDLYFPETINKPRKDEFYFDYTIPKYLVRNRLVKSCQIPDISSGNTVVYKYILRGKFRELRFERWVRKNVGSLKIHGNIKLIKKGKYELKIGGRIKNVNKFDELIQNFIPKVHKVKEIKREEYDGAINIGFKVETESKIGLYVENEEPSEKAYLKRKVESLEKELNNIYTSKSWKLVKFLRSLKFK